MKRRDFSAGLLAAGAIGLPVMAQQQPVSRVTPAEYRQIGRPAPVDAPQGKIELVEFFWYSCPHCNAFEPVLQEWSKKLPSDVVLRRIPVAFRDDFVPQQRLFYTLEALGKVDELHAKVFQAIHAERQPLVREEPILAWAQKQGLDRAKFQEVFNSFAVSAKTKRAVQMQDAYSVEGVPALGVAGRFYTDGSVAGTMQRAVQVAEHLIAEIRKSR
ncbi:MAG TPA: thiol:disulfide interchange protein DsbA/DsbL [Ramlibacter sp.]|nr:thiol:disulfide interchange protein DsbA/DsbL [Ramlibacter sp.]